MIRLSLIALTALLISACGGGDDGAVGNGDIDAPQASGPVQMQFTDAKSTFRPMEVVRIDISGLELERDTFVMYFDDPDEGEGIVLAHIDSSRQRAFLMPDLGTGDHVLHLFAPDHGATQLAFTLADPPIIPDPRGYLDELADAAIAGINAARADLPRLVNEFDRQIAAIEASRGFLDQLSDQDALSLAVQVKTNLDALETELGKREFSVLKADDCESAFLAFFESKARLLRTGIGLGISAIPALIPGVNLTSPFIIGTMVGVFMSDFYEFHQSLNLFADVCVGESIDRVYRPTGLSTYEKSNPLSTKVLQDREPFVFVMDYSRDVVIQRSEYIREDYLDRVNEQMQEINDLLDGTPLGRLLPDGLKLTLFDREPSRETIMNPGDYVVESISDSRISLLDSRVNGDALSLTFSDGASDPIDDVEFDVVLRNVRDDVTTNLPVRARARADTSIEWNVTRGTQTLRFADNSAAEFRAATEFNGRRYPDRLILRSSIDGVYITLLGFNAENIGSGSISDHRLSRTSGLLCATGIHQPAPRRADSRYCTEETTDYTNRAYTGFINLRRDDFEDNVYHASFLFDAVSQQIDDDTDDTIDEDFYDESDTVTVEGTAIFRVELSGADQ